MARRFIFAIFCVLLLGGNASAGWYHVENYQGTIGSQPVHVSLQTYDSFGSGITVEGSYFYDAKQSPIAVYGKLNGTALVLCEIADDKELDRVLVIGSRTPVDTTGCPFSLDIGKSGATGTWSKGPDRMPITLKKVASLDNTGKAEIDGTVEIPFWTQTATHRFAGVYEKAGFLACMTKLQVINKKKKKVVQEIEFRGDDCNAGMLMTPIYMNVQKQRERNFDIISVNFAGGSSGYTQDYVFSARTMKYHQLVN